MSCYPIINELLCYMVNFLNDSSSPHNANALVKETVSNFFSNEEIAEAKKTLWRACNDKLDDNYITSSTGNDNDVNDIILALEKLESENAIPEIVAKNLLCIPVSDEVTLLTLQRKMYEIEKSQRNHAQILHKHTVEIENTSEKVKETSVKLDETNLKLEETNNTVNVYKTKLEIFEFSPTSDEPVRKAVKKTSKSAPASRNIFENGIGNDSDSSMPAEGGKNRQVISLHIGQAGVQMGASCWELYCLEHGLRPDGTTDPYISAPISSDAFFAETQDGSHCARSIFMDLEPSVVDEIRTGGYKSLFHPEDLINHKEDAANNFARGHYTVGQAIIEEAMERIRRNAEVCGGLQGFMMFHSFGGGTGSGFTSLLLDRISTEYGKSNLLRYAVFPSPKLSTSVVEPINTVLHASATMERDHCVFIFDNEATYNLCHHKLGIARPHYTHLNHHVAQVVSASTAALRFDGDLNVDMQDFRTNLVPLPRLHFPIMSYAPVIAKERATYAQPDACGITNLCFDPLGQMITCDLQNGKYMSCCLLYRGDVMPADVQRAIASIKVKRSVEFVSWCPSGFKIGINTQAPTVIPHGDLAKTTRAVTMLANTTATVHTWSRINHKFDLMFNKRAFIHWYMGEGLEEGEMLEARENLAVLERDYREVSGDPDDPFDGNEEY